MPIPFAVNELLRITLKGNFLGSVGTNNVFFYEVGSIDPTTGSQNTLYTAALSFWNNIKDELRAITSEHMFYNEVECAIIDKSAYAPVNAEIYPIPGAERVGLHAGDALPPSNAWTYRYIRPNLQARHGYKRFCGIAEAAQFQGVAHPTMTTVLNNLADALQAQVFITEISPNADAGIMYPRILRTERNGQEVRPIEVHTPMDVVYSHIGTQNSRKYGHGS